MTNQRMLRVVTVLGSLVLGVTLALPDDVSARDRGGSGYRSYRGAKAVDGDTFRHGGQRHRLRDYNAPERGQPGSGHATQDLQRRLDSGNYEYKSVGRDVYGRPIVEERRSRR